MGIINAIDKWLYRIVIFPWFSILIFFVILIINSLSNKNSRIGFKEFLGTFKSLWDYEELKRG
jgi:hypothetical protein